MSVTALYDDYLRVADGGRGPMNPMMKVVVLLAVTASQWAWADVYRCRMPGGAVRYQELPCVEGKQDLVKTPASPRPPSQGSDATDSSATAVGITSPAAAQSRGRPGHPEPAQRPFSPNDPIQLNLPEVPLKAAFQVMADYAGYKLAIDPSINVTAYIVYPSVKWSTALADMSLRYGVTATVEGNVLRVTKR